MLISLLKVYKVSFMRSLRVEHNSRLRYPKIVDACFKSGYIDARGRCTLKIIDACRDAGLPEPEIIEKDGGVQVTLFKNEGGPIGGPIGGPMGGPINELSIRQKEILELIKTNHRITKRSLAKTLNINVSAAQAHLDALKDKEIIIREGGTRGYWKILIKES